MARYQTMFDLKQQCTEVKPSVAMQTFWRNFYREMLEELTESWQQKISAQYPEISIKTDPAITIVLKKSTYTLQDPEFRQFYTALRQCHQKKIMEAARQDHPIQTPSTNHFALSVEAILDQEFSQTSQLIAFNQIVKDKYYAIKEHWKTQITTQQNALLPYLGDPTDLDTAVQALLQGDVSLLATAHAKQLLEETKELINLDQLEKSIYVKRAWEKLFVPSFILHEKKLLETYHNLKKKPAPQQQCPDYSHLKPYFRQAHFTRAIHLFLQGQEHSLTDITTEKTLREIQQELSGDLQKQAHANMQEQRNHLANNLDQIVQQQVDTFRHELATNQENKIASFIQETKTEYQQRIHACDKMEITMQMLQLGPINLDKVPPHTRYRIPAVMTCHKETTVYGGVSARPSFKKVDTILEDAQKKLDTATDCTRQDAIDHATQLLTKIPFTVMLDNWALKHQIFRLESKINQAKMDEIRTMLMPIPKHTCSFFQPTGTTWVEQVNRQVFETVIQEFHTTPQTPSTRLEMWRMTETLTPNSPVLFKNKLTTFALSTLTHLTHRDPLTWTHLAVVPFEKLKLYQPHELRNFSNIRRADNPLIYVILPGSEGNPPLLRITPRSMIEATGTYNPWGDRWHIDAQPREYVYHSDLAEGKPVLAAGEVWFENGQPCYINANSGHYMPTNIKSVVTNTFQAHGFSNVKRTYYNFFEPDPRLTVPDFRSRLETAELPAEGFYRFAAPESYDPSFSLPRNEHGAYIDRFGNAWTLQADTWKVQLSRIGEKAWTPSPEMNMFQQGPIVLSVSKIGTIIEP